MVSTIYKYYDHTCIFTFPRIKYNQWVLFIIILLYPMVTVNPFLPGDMKVETGFCPERLKNIREERGLNKAEAARLLGLSKMGYLRYETAARTPSWQTIVFMAQKFGISPEYLTGVSEDPEPAEYLISRSDDPELFDLVKDMINTKNPARNRLLAYHQKLKADSGQ